jgi:hypothetical protein
MSDIADAIHHIERQIALPKARCVIADEGFPDESSLMGTRDGYLNMVLALLRLVAAFDAGRRHNSDEGFAWDDGIREAMYQLPTNSAWLVGAYLFQSHEEYMADLSRIVDPQLKCPLRNDPQFRDPRGK